jgi:hypothetical protein
MLSYFYTNRYCRFAIRQRLDDWVLECTLGPNHDSAPIVLKYFQTPQLAVHAVAQQAAGFEPWDKAPQIPKDCGNIKNWRTGEDAAVPPVGSEPPNTDR